MMSWAQNTQTIIKKMTRDEREKKSDLINFQHLISVYFLKQKKMFFAIKKRKELSFMRLND
jgi:hypothetical protein